VRVTQQLHDAGIAYTGARPDFYDPTRQQMKKACRARGLLTPPYAFISNLEDARRAARSLQFPLIVKPAQGYGSIGIRRTSRVMNEIALLDEVARQLELFDSALIEEFIDGREFTVLVAENPVSATWPLVYQPVEIFFPPGETFKHFDLKWRAFRGMRTVPCQDPQLAGLLMDISRSFFLEMGGSGYARCDIRLDTAGAAYLLEINPNCGIFYPPDNPGSADYILMNDPAGHCGFIETIFRVAEQRRKLPA
jgi:D-alanine-D-alanine ligase